MAAFLFVPVVSAASQKAPQEKPPQPLILESQGSFFVGGQFKPTTVGGTQSGAGFGTA